MELKAVSFLPQPHPNKVINRITYRGTFTYIRLWNGMLSLDSVSLQDKKQYNEALSLYPTLQGQTEKQAKHMLQLLKIAKGSAFEQNKQF